MSVSLFLQVSVAAQDLIDFTKTRQDPFHPECSPAENPWIKLELTVSRDWVVTSLQRLKGLGLTLRVCPLRPAYNKSSYSMETFREYLQTTCIHQ